MSQIQSLVSGTVAPNIEHLTGDVGGVIGPDGAFNINLLTGDGLTSTGNPATNTITFTVDGLTLGTGTTIGAVTADVITLNLGAVASTWIIEAKVIGHDAVTPGAVGYNLICVAETTGAAATIIGIQDKYVAEKAGFAPCDSSFVAAGNTIIVLVTGMAGRTLSWKSVTTSMGV